MLNDNPQMSAPPAMRLGSSIPPNGVDSTPSMLGNGPADRPNFTLAELLSLAAAKIGEDGQIDPSEQQDVSAFLQFLKGVQARQMAMAPGASMQQSTYGQPTYEGPGDVGPAGVSAQTGPYGSQYGSASGVGPAQ